MADTRAILICDDNVDHLMLMRREIERASAVFRVVTVTTAAACLAELERDRFDVVIIDYLLRDRNGLDLLHEIAARFPECVVIMITGMGNEDVAVQAMKSGADDYVIKSSGGFAVVPLVVTRALERRELLNSRRALEREATRAGQLNLLGAVALGVAHDVNELLGTILGRIQLLREESADGDVLAQLAVAETAARDAALIMERILEFSRPAAEWRMETVDLSRLTGDCLEFTRPRWETGAQRRGVAYQIVNEVAPGLTAEAPAAFLREVITNLVVNALDAMPDGGMLILRGRGMGDGVRVSIQDTGVGMDGATLAHLFDPLFTSGKPGGHGIGLATSRALLERMGGRIEVESERDVGTTFTLVLGGREAGRGAETPRAPAVARTRQRVLVVDNEPRVAALMQDILAAEGHEVAVAYSGEEAMSKFRPGACDVLCCDLSLPGASGLAVARAVRALDASVAIVLVTGWGGDAALADSEPGTVDLVAAKPLDVTQVRDLVGKASQLVAQRRAGADASPPARQA